MSKFSGNVLSGLLVVGLLSGVATASAAAKDFKVAVVDFQNVIDTTKEGKKAKDSINKEASDRQDLIKTKQDEIKKKEEEFSKKQLVLTQTVREEKQKELQNLYMELQKMVMESEKTFKQKFASTSQDIVKKIQGVVTKLAVDKGYDLVLEKSQVPYYQSSFEITQDVIKLYDQTYK